jgi:NAD(P)H-dependent flavin oxidoreductase YrpB (nitropropane dioxygenase family)
VRQAFANHGITDEVGDADPRRADTEDDYTLLDEGSPEARPAAMTPPRTTAPVPYMSALNVHTCGRRRKRHSNARLPSQGAVASWQSSACDAVRV